MEGTAGELTEISASGEAGFLQAFRVLLQLLVSLSASPAPTLESSCLQWQNPFKTQQPPQDPQLCSQQEQPGAGRGLGFIFPPHPLGGGGSRVCRPPRGWQNVSQQLGPDVGCGEQPGSPHCLLDGTPGPGLRREGGAQSSSGVFSSFSLSSLGREAFWFLPVPPLLSCATLSKLCKLSEPQLFYL